MFDDDFAQQLGLSDLTPDERERVLQCFDPDFYLAENPALQGCGSDPFVHYMTVGWRQGLDPSPDFHTLEYLLKHREVLKSGDNPFVTWAVGSGRGKALTVDEPVFGEGTKQQPTGEKPSPEVKLPHAAPQVKALNGSVETVADISSPSPESWSAVPLEDSIPSDCESLSRSDFNKVRDAFNGDYYLRANPDVAKAGVDPFQHYMSLGWKELRDPCETFSTSFYLSYFSDIAQSRINPFVHWVLHGISEKRAAMSFRQKVLRRSYTPTVAAIIPNFNHGPYLSQRIESILCQTYPNLTITVLDDCSTDNSRDIIDSFVERYPGRISAIYNDTNSGGVFRQWEKGVKQTESELIWICESDDFCEPDFLENLVHFFGDDSIQIAFGRILETDHDGVHNFELDNYRELAEPGIWHSTLVRPAAAWFANAFGVRNVIANVGGCVWRRAPIPDGVWKEAAGYSVVGDWYLYGHIASGGQIAWEPRAVSYFRRHGENTSSNSFLRPRFYSELERLMLSLRDRWDIPSETVIRFHQKIVEQFEWFELEHEFGSIDDHCSLLKLLKGHRRNGHILLASYGFIPGGGENFPIFLANGLVERGWTVSFLIFETSEVNQEMRRALNPSVSVYDASWALEYGPDRFLTEAGISLIHSHTVGAEMHFFHMWRIKTNLRFIVTLHGSYEASELTHELLETITSPVDHFVYTADKNLVPFRDLDIPKERFTKMPNAMPIDPLPFPRTRRDLGIAEDAIVFTLVARGIKRKGWRAAINAFLNLRDKHSHLPMHLCLVGEGEEPDRHKTRHGRDPNISFLGYQARISGLYRMSDVALVPTRFAGESFPLCIIQALQVGTPVIGADVGEIGTMILDSEGMDAGLLIDAPRDTERFTEGLAAAMERFLLDEPLRKRLAIGAEKAGKAYDMDTLVDAYDELYRSIIGNGASENHPNLVDHAAYACAAV